ncbi:MAG: hypothetical protein LBK61_14555 [Spirochaetaceae bacterium]|jgi:hypothetical protein|nr:hypothetical protein [Spirochaetaceae bacterium]
MIEIELKAGDIFTWQNYPLYMDEFKAQRWFLYLGNQAIEAIVYQITTTTQYYHYETGGNRMNNNFFRIPSKTGGLTRDSIVDLTLFFEKIPEEFLNEHKADIEKKGSLNQDYVNKLVTHIKNDRHITRIEKKDIFGYLKEAGFNVSNK